MLKRILLVLLLGSPVAFGADVNGYTAAYECRAGGAQCDVDVATYTTDACAQTITTADSEATIESKLNTGPSPICATNGDYSDKGTINITASGTAGARRVLRYTRSGDDGDEPWNQTGANQATFKAIILAGNYWIIHRVRVAGGDTQRTESNGTNGIWNRMLVENSNIRLFRFQGTGNTLQNSVIRNAGDDFTASSDEHCVDSGGGNVSNGRVVNNEIYNCTGDGFQNNSGTNLSGFVIENNDFYITSAYTAPASNGRACAEQGIDIKHPVATSGNPARIIHNRFWGFRRTDTGCGGTGSNGEGLLVNGDTTPADWVLIQDNIFIDMPGAVGVNAGTGQRISIIGNLIYKINDPSGTVSAQGFKLQDSDTTEVYLNTIIDADDNWTRLDDNGTNDYRCNVAIASGAHTGSLGSGSQLDRSAYYGVSGTKLDTTNVDKALNTRANLNNYDLGDIIRTTATPGEDGSARDFLYEVIQAGTSHVSSVSYCTTPGCTTVDGSMIVQAIRGPYSFYRKLRTGAELVYIPYARIYSGAPEITLCPSGFASRSGIGIDNTQP